MISGTERRNGRIRYLDVTFSLPFAVAALLLLPAAAQTADGAPPGGGFSLPLACTLGTDCWVMNYPDLADGPAVKDPYCGARSYDTHKGTDFAIPDAAAMGRGVDVLAAADGRVLRWRDGENDRPIVGKVDPASLRGRDCGNGVVIDHGDGWETQYCHLRKGSVSVRPGQTVRRGDRLGLVGMSGRTEFPHVHITIRHDKTVVDPLTGGPVPGQCGATGKGLWREPALTTYPTGALYAVGVADGPVTTEAVRENVAPPASISADAGALVVWAALFGGAPGDRLTLTITGPDGRRVYHADRQLKRYRAWRYIYAGKRRRGEPWSAGLYEATVGFHHFSGKIPALTTRRVPFEIR